MIVPPDRLTSISVAFLALSVISVISVMLNPVGSPFQSTDAGLLVDENSLLFVLPGYNFSMLVAALGLPLDSIRS